MRRIVQMIIAVVILFCGVFPLSGISTALAVESEVVYSDVLDDLHKDENFDESYYPEDDKDYSIQLIQIAESSAQELFAYIYQPGGQALDLRASYIRISTNPKEAIEPKDYTLKHINSSGVFYKYLIEDFKVSSDDTRYYGVVQIMRPWIKDVDPSSGTDNEITQQPFSVQKQYTFGELNGKPFVREEHIDTIEVTDKFVGFCRYPEGGFEFSVTSEACDAHYVAFNTDRQIDKLIEADLQYSTQSVYDYFHTVVGGSSGTVFGEIIKQPLLTITGEKVSYEGDGWWASKYSWNRIQTVDEFIATEKRHDVYKAVKFNKVVDTELTLDIEKELKGKYSWVLRFVETDYTLQGTSMGYDQWYTNIEDVTILRLQFVTNGATYNLGVIDNMQSEPADPDKHKPSNSVTEKFNFGDEGCPSSCASLWGILGLILIIILIILCFPILKYLIQGIVWIVSWPFKAIKKAIDKHKRE